MAYEKQTWTTGDIITAEKLNHMEDGIETASSGGGGDIFTMHFTVDFDGDNNIVVTCDKTPTDIFAAYDDGKIFLAKTVFWNTLPEEVTMKCEISNYEGYPETICIYGTAFYQQSSSQATQGDVIFTYEIYYDFLYSKWEYINVGYELTPAQS